LLDNVLTNRQLRTASSPDFFGMLTIYANTEFPGYEILSELGRANARVLKARHTATGDLVAIKHFSRETDPEILRRFAREAEIMTGVLSPNVVKIREVQLLGRLPFIVMEWIEGGDLRSFIKQRHSLDVPTTIRLGLQIAEALKIIHPAGIVHRDIKPENILYRELASGEFHFLLTDFGVARLREQANFTKTGQSMMTYDYASPEQFDNPKDVGIASDYYSLGVVLYECLGGNVPFSMGDGTGLGTFINRVMREAPAPLTLVQNAELPASLNILLTKLLVKQPTDRLRDANELELLLRQADVERLQAGIIGEQTLFMRRIIPLPPLPATVRGSAPESFKFLADADPHSNEFQPGNSQSARSSFVQKFIKWRRSL
jgi:eukaryotic-like serine/threonine-protein kinase